MEYYCYYVWCRDMLGRRGGDEFATRVEADCHFNLKIRSSDLVTVILYGWTGSDNIEELRKWAA